jgi:hypothetical protein
MKSEATQEIYSMKHTHPKLLTALLLAPLAALHAAGALAPKPNVLLIITDESAVMMPRS